MFIKLIEFQRLDEFKSYAALKPEYARIFLVYNEIKILRNNIDIERLATTPVDELEIGPDSNPTQESVLTKRPLGEKPKEQSDLNNIESVREVNFEDEAAKSDTLSAPKQSINKFD